MPLRRAIEERRFAQTQLQTSLQIVRLATDTRRAYFQAVAAQQSLVYMKQVDQAAQASSELADRMTKAGNWGKLEQARELAFRHEVAVQLARAEYNVNITHERLVRLLGLGDSHQALKLPERLPDLPVSLRRIDEIETQALAQRLDVQVAKLDTESTAKSLGLMRATRFVNAFEVGYQNKSASNASLAEGYQVEFSLPLFDWGQARVRRAESVYMRSFYRATDVALQARSEAREGYGAYRTNFDIARQYRDEIIPARKRISDEVLLRYNGMLSSVFELLADARAQITSINSAIDAQRDFWIAESEMNFVVNGGSLTPSLSSVPVGNATPTGAQRAH
jgi:outer membrane protein TolC